jgi:hypothetical protein
VTFVKGPCCDACEAYWGMTCVVYICAGPRGMTQVSDMIEDWTRGDKLCSSTVDPDLE